LNHGRSQWADLRSPIAGLRPFVERIADLPRELRGAILWVDDHPENNARLIEMLQDVGVSVAIATSTEAALVRLREASAGFSLAITDLGRGDVPDAGVETAREIRALDPLLPVIVFSSVQAIASFGGSAREEGAVLCTSGAASLLNGIFQCLRRSRRVRPGGAQ
jgi:CheY-like chemotaxis protein